MDPLVSVIIITYNHQKFIAQAITSVLNQKTNFKFEIIIGDDFSNDKTREIIDSYRQQFSYKIQVVFPANNQGAIVNEKNCVELSTGKYIAFLEGDDFWTDQLKLQKQIDFLEANPDFGLVHADVNHYYEYNGKTIFSINRTNKTKIKQGHIFDELLKPNPLFIKTATVCLRKELVQNYFDYNLAIKENWPLTDLPLWIDISYYSKIHYMDETFATYRLLNESASRTQLPQKKYDYHNALYKIKLYYLKKYNCPPNVKQLLEENYYRTLIAHAFRLKDVTIINQAVTFLKSNKYKISVKEYLIILAIKNKFLKSVIALIILK